LNLIKKIAALATIPLCLSLLGLALPARAATGGTINVVAGWNLLGNGKGSPIAVDATFGDAKKVASLWKWLPAKKSWAFYSPTADNGAAYAASKGFLPLTTVAGGEGFWLNAKTAFTAPLPTSPAIVSSSFQKGGANALPVGWSLIASGDHLTASEFNQTLSLTDAPVGHKPVNIMTLWAWNPVQDRWYFYSPSLEAEGDKAQAAYLAAKGFLNFGTKVILPATGFWVNAFVAQGPAPVLLGSAGNFVILAKTAISTTGTTDIVGNIGISPAAASFITGFGLVADATNHFAKSSLVTGRIFAANYAVPTPAKMTAAISDMEIAFTDAAGRSGPDHTELYAGDISGRTLAPGLYKWSTGVLVTNAGVTLTGGANDVWILQIAQNLTVSSSAVVTLSGGAQAKNIFWQVSGQATIGTAAEFQGILLTQTLIALKSGAVLNGRALSQTAVTLQANALGTLN
jgi:hypothetical protein